MALRDHPHAAQEREVVEGLFAALPEAGRERLLRRIRTRSQAQDWPEHVPDARAVANTGIL
ncbi:MAG: hypothetical protein HUU14_05310 [Dehalococcoidia bacterium]|nr:hypothetical protein [Dehalococcoidia bacterium]NUQ55286.1 hypothetical protein [Dehalococcoidia bacterium]RIL04164.1 MAG: hypothetical protein DCC78_00835 [bacterium]